MPEEDERFPLSSFFFERLIDAVWSTRSLTKPGFFYHWQ